MGACWRPFCATVAALVPFFTNAKEPEGLAGLRMECDTCDGSDSVSPTPDQTPSLARKSERYLSKQLQAFRSGKRKHESMPIMGSKLSDEELRTLARYYARVKR